MKLACVVFTTAVMISAAAAPDREAPAPSPGEMPAGMAVHQVAFMVPVPVAEPLAEVSIQAIQQGHLSYLQRLSGEGKLLVEGPIHGSGPFRSVIVLDVPTRDAAREILSHDPWVKSGQLQPELHSWWAMKGVLKRPQNVKRNALCYLGLLKRPPDAPSYPEAKLREIQEGHLANIRAMADLGDLVLAGPMEEDTALRGLLVFRSTDPDRIREMVARDPAVKAGRLGLELYPWYVPEGTLPPAGP